MLLESCYFERHSHVKQILDVEEYHKADCQLHVVKDKHGVAGLFAVSGVV